MPSGEGSAARLLPGIDRAAFIVALGRRLRDAGVPVTLPAFAAFTRALEAAPPHDVGSLYWPARVSLVHHPGHLAAFDAVFHAVFSEAVLQIDPAAGRQRRDDLPTGEDALAPLAADPSTDQSGSGLPWHTLPHAVESDRAEDAEQVLPELLPSALEQFGNVPFEDLDEGQLVTLGRWLERAMQRWPTRRSRRRQVHPAGDRVALRETIARSRRTGWEPVHLSRTRPVLRPRTVTMLADVSQSMQSYSTAYLHLMRALARSGRAETFAFSTSLTRLTPALRHRSAEVAIAQATEQVVDRYGGTHVAGSLRALLTSRWGTVLRGGVLVIASDGWDSDEPTALAGAMVRAQRRAHRIIWLNPRAAAPGFAPLVGSMAAALPFCDEFLPANTVRNMLPVLDAIARTREAVR